jgi:prepilin-type processing-associated H-X9-DG protein
MGFRDQGSGIREGISLPAFCGNFLYVPAVHLYNHGVGWKRREMRGKMMESDVLGQRHAPAATSGFAIASFVCSLLGCLVVPAFLGLAFGIVAMVKAGKSPLSGGRGLALAGIIISCAFIVLMPFALISGAVMMPALARARAAARNAASIHNLKQIGLGCHMYAQTNDENFPVEGLDELYPTYIASKEVFVCPSAFHTKEEIDPGSPEVKVIDYAYVKGLRAADRPRLVLAYEKEAWHEGKRNVLFVDGSVMAMSGPELEKALAETEDYLRQKGRR